MSTCERMLHRPCEQKDRAVTDSAPQSWLVPRASRVLGRGQALRGFKAT